MANVKHVEKGSVTPIPPFKTLEEGANFWDSHSVVDGVGQNTLVGFHQANKTGSITIRFHPKHLRLLKREAFGRGIGPTTLARMWVLERLSGSSGRAYLTR